MHHFSQYYVQCSIIWFLNHSLCALCALCILCALCTVYILERLHNTHQWRHTVDVDWVPLRGKCLHSAHNLRLQAELWINFLVHQLVSTEIYHSRNIGPESSSLCCAHRYFRTKGKASIGILYTVFKVVRELQRLKTSIYRCLIV